MSRSSILSPQAISRPENRSLPPPSPPELLSQSDDLGCRSSRIAWSNAEFVSAWSLSLPRFSRTPVSPTLLPFFFLLRLAKCACASRIRELHTVERMRVAKGTSGRVPSADRGADLCGVDNSVCRFHHSVWPGFFGSSAFRMIHKSLRKPTSFKQTERRHGCSDLSFRDRGSGSRYRRAKTSLLYLR